LELNTIDVSWLQQTFAVIAVHDCGTVTAGVVTKVVVGSTTETVEVEDVVVAFAKTLKHQCSMSL